MSELIFRQRDTISPVNEAGSSSGCPIPEDPKLIAEGWKSRFFGDARMVNDASETYKQMNHEVKVVPIDISNMKESCDGCKPAFDKFFVIYTRKL